MVNLAKIWFILPFQKSFLLNNGGIKAMGRMEMRTRRKIKLGWTDENPTLEIDPSITYSSLGISLRNGHKL